jgi:protein involved in polysaccharide export with SLBB domain
VVVLVLVLLVGAGLKLQAQMVGPRMASRADLNTMLDSLQTVAINERDEDGRRALQNQISGLAYRLQQGDIWPGDIIDLSVSGEAKWVGQFTVAPGRRLELEDVDPLSLEGVLYSEAEESITLQLARYLREPRVRVDVLKRIGVLGSVGSPGFYDVPGSSLVSDVIMLAGGPAGSANVDKVEFRRLGTRIAESRPRVVWQTLSLDQLGVNSGDEMYVPDRPTPPFQWVLGALGVGLSLLFLYTRIF